MKNGAICRYANSLSRYADQILAASIVHHTKAHISLTPKHRLKLILQHTTPEECYCKFCNRPNKIFQFKMKSHCGSRECQKIETTAKCIERKSYLSFQTESAKLKRNSKMKGRKFSDLHKLNLSESKKKIWTDEYKLKCVSDRKQAGVYDRIAATMRNKVQEGYTPKNNRTRSKKKYVSDTGVVYRSSWEYVFHKENPHLNFEVTRIPYTFEGKSHIYIVDFTDDVSRALYEVKPTAYLKEAVFVAKQNAAVHWCAINNYKYNIITEDDYKKSISSIDKSRV